MPNFPPTLPSLLSAARIKSEGFDWLVNSHPWDVWATLTTKEYTTLEAARADLKHFWNILDRKAYGNAAKKGKQLISRICLIDLGANNTNVHYHIVALTPTDVKWMTEGFCKLIEETWAPLRNAGHHNQAEPIKSIGGCVGYISGKFKGNLDSLDLDCSRF